MEYRNAIDVMTTETTCWSSIWETDEKTEEYLAIHGRAGDYKKLAPAEVAYYDGVVYIDLSKIKPVIALPFHPSNVYTIEEFQANTMDILDATEKAVAAQFPGRGVGLDLKSKFFDGAFHVDQGVVAGCSGGTFDSLCQVADILDGESVGNGAFSLSVYPGSQPVYLELLRNGAAARDAWRRARFCANASAAPASARATPRRTANSPSATRRATSRTARAVSRARGSLRA